MVNIYRCLAGIQRRQGKYSDALSNLKDALNIIGELGSKKLIGECYYCAGLIYCEAKILDESKKFFLMLLRHIKSKIVILQLLLLMVELVWLIKDKEIMMKH